MSPFSRPRGAPYGNSNAFKHGLYSNNLKKRPPSEKDTTIIKSLSDEIALIRLFTQKLIDRLDPSADVSELTDILRILCISSTTITRILRVHFLITANESILDSDIEAAVQQVSARLINKQASSAAPAVINLGAGSSSDPHHPAEAN